MACCDSSRHSSCSSARLTRRNGPRFAARTALALPPARIRRSPGMSVASTNVAWRIQIPGLGHSSPIVWGDRVYLTSAIADGAAAQSVAVGDSDSAGIDPAKDQVPHRWQLFALDRATGKPVWSRTVHQGVPRAKRHVKSSHASATPATNGKIVVAMFDSEGLFAFDAERNGAVAEGSRRARARARRRSHLRVGPGQLSGDSRQHRARPERSLSGLVPDRVRSHDRQGIVALAARRAAVVGDAARARAWRRADRRHELAAVRARPRFRHAAASGGASPIRTGR